MLVESPVSPGRTHFPDLIPKQIKSPKREQQITTHIRPSSGDSLPRPGSSSRQVLLEAVKETLERRKIPAQEESAEERRKEAFQHPQSPRVGFYQFRHDETAFGQDKLSRLSVQKLPSVTIATRTAERQLNHVISVQSPSIDPILPATAAAAVQELIDPDDRATVDIQPDDVARLVSDFLAGQLELAVDSLGTTIQEQHPPFPERSQVKIKDFLVASAKL